MTSFRFPYGTCTASSLDLVDRFGLAAIQWDVVTADPALRQSAKAITDIVSKRARPGSIIVMHGNGRGWHTEEALRTFVPQLRALGFQFVTVRELLAKGRPVAVNQCYELKPGDNEKYDQLVGVGTGEKR